MKKLFCSIDQGNIFKKILFYLLSMIVIGFLCFLAVVLVYCIPTQTNMKEHMQQSCFHFLSEQYEYTYMEHMNSQSEVYQDALFLCIAAEDVDEGPIIGAIKNKFNSPSQARLPQFDIIKLYDPDNFPFSDYPYVDDYEYDYGRYWHGYLTYLKPLLFFFNYGGIRTVLMFFSVFLFAILLLVTFKRNKLLCIPVFLFYVFLNPVMLGLSLMYFPVYFLSMLFMILISVCQKWVNRNWTNLCFIYMLFGALTMFFDAMSFPFLALFVPLSLNLVLTNKNLKHNVLMIILAVLFWGIGYFVMMGVKLALLYFVCGEGSLMASLSKAGSWFQGEEDFVSIVYNAYFEGTQPFVVFSTILLILITIYMIIKTRKVYINLLVPTIIICVSPIAIMLILKFHTVYHLQFSFREFGITYFAISAYCAFCLNELKSLYYAETTKSKVKTL